VDQFLRRIFAAGVGHRDAQFLQADCIATGPESVLVQPTTGALSMSLSQYNYASMVMHDRNASKETSIIDY